MYGNKKETDKKGAGKKGMPRVRERIWDEYENGWHCTVPSLWMGGEDLIMTCNGCKAKDVGACTAHGGTGWDPRAGNEGNGAAGTDSERGIIKPCPHRYAGCISQNGYMCFHEGPCDPCDSKGHRFTVVYSVVDGQTLMAREYGRKKELVFGIPDEIINADAAIAGTAFADAVPFDPAKFISDIVCR